MKATLIPFVFCILCLAGAASVHADIKAAEQHLAATEFDKAAAALSDGAKIPADRADYAKYLRAMALALGGKHGDAVTACDLLISKHPDSEWIPKARFLKARSLIEQRKHKEAEVIFAAEARRLFSSERKEDIANVLVTFGDRFATERKPGDLTSPPADYNKALALYQQALALEVGRDFKDGVWFKVGKMYHRGISQGYRQGQSIPDRSPPSTSGRRPRHHHACPRDGTFSSP